MNSPYLGRNGHIAVGTPDVPAAVAGLESRGFTFRPETPLASSLPGTIWS